MVFEKKISISKMNIKKLIVLFGFLAIAGLSVAQDDTDQDDVSMDQDSSPCDNKFGVDSTLTLENVSMFNQHFQAKEFVEAFPYWYYLYNNAPCYNKRITYNGPLILKKAMQDSLYKDRMDGLIDTVFLCYQKRIELFGGEAEVKALWANDLGKLRPAQRLEAIDMFFESVTELGNKSSYSTPLNFVYMGIKAYKKKQLSLDSVFIIYDMVLPIIDHNVAIEGKYQAKWQKTEETVTKLMLPYLDCEQIIKLKQPKFVSNMNNEAYLRSSLKLLEKGGCESEEFYMQLSEQLYLISPDPMSAVGIAKAAIGKENYGKALSYYELAIDSLEGDAKYNAYIQMGNLCIATKKFSTARVYANKALAMNENSGDAYIIIGDSYAASMSSCSGSKLGGREVYWAAVDKYYKAKQVDPSVEERATEKIVKYSKYFPTKEDVFFLGLNPGQSYSVGCWINEGTTVRTID